MPAKKMIIVSVLDILKKYTDADHRLTQQRIAELLERDYGLSVDRKSVRRNIDDLISFGYNIFCTETVRKNSHGEEITTCTGWYYEHDFSDGELKLLIEGLMFSKTVPDRQRAELIKKLEGLSNEYFRAGVGNISSLHDRQPKNKQIFLTIETIDEALASGKKLSFHYNAYGTDFKIHPRLDSEQKPRVYVINPLKIAAANDRYYLICNNDKYDNISHYRIDMITDAKVLSQPAKDKMLIQGLENGLDMPRHMAEHIYMFAGQSVRVQFRAKKNLVGDIIDWFGTDIKFFDETDSEVSVIVLVNENAMLYWLLQYGESVEVLSPASLRQKVRAVVGNMADKYSKP